MKELASAWEGIYPRYKERFYPIMLKCGAKALRHCDNVRVMMTSPVPIPILNLVKTLLAALFWTFPLAEVLPGLRATLKPSNSSSNRSGHSNFNIPDVPTQVQMLTLASTCNPSLPYLCPLCRRRSRRRAGS